MKKLYMIITLILGVVFISLLLLGFRFTTTNAIPGDIQLISSQKTVYGKAVLFEDTIHKNFGVASLKKYLGFLYRFDGSTIGNHLEEDKPFKAIGLWDGNQKIDGFLVVVKTAELSDIRYMTCASRCRGLRYLYR